MPVSQNGYSANDRSVLQAYNVGTTKFMFRKGAPGWLLWHFFTWFDANIRDINPGILDDWSYAERPIRGGEDLSNHASGTAGDVDATKWPLGVAPEVYLTPAEIAKVRAQLKLYEGAIRWGGDYTGRKDPMHFEINKDEAFCNRIQAKLQNTEEEFDMDEATLRKIVNQEVTKVLRSEGASGAGDAGVMLKRGYRQAFADAVRSVLGTKAP